MADVKYPLAKETIDREDLEALAAWLLSDPSPKLTMGALTLEFERKWADFIGTRKAVFCNSGSSANLLMVAAAKSYLEKSRKRQLRAIVPSVGWVTTVSPFIQLGFDVRMVGADKQTFGIDLDQLERECKSWKPDVVIFVQVLGVPHYKDRLKLLSSKFGFLLLEDGCAALGAAYSDGSKVGTVGHMSSFSFYFGHQLSTIEGGMVNTDDHELHQIMMMLRSHGWGKDLDLPTREGLMALHDIDTFHSPFTFFLPGYNLRGTDLQAFLGIRQVLKANSVCQKRHENHVRYAGNLRHILQFQEWGSDYPVSISFGCLARSADERRYIVERLVEASIETRLFSAGNLGRHPFWKQSQGSVFVDTMSDMIHETGFFLPNYPELTAQDVYTISSVTIEACQHYRKMK